MQFASLQNQKKNNNKFKTKKLEVSENQTVWKSNNQGIKEETFIQTDRRDKDGQQELRGYIAWQQTRWTRWQLVDWEGPHLWQISWEAQVGSETDYTTQGSSAGK